MAEDFLAGADLDAIFEAMEQDLIEQDTDFTIVLNNVVEEIVDDEKIVFQCQFCDKVCFSKRGRTRHTNSKHSAEETTSKISHTQNKIVERDAFSMCHPLYFKKFTEICVEKLSNDKCYPTYLREEFKQYKMTVDDISNFTYHLFEDCIGSFDGNGEKFLPKFYNIVSKSPCFKNLSISACRLLGCEVANHVLSHLSHKKTTGISNLNPTKKVFSERENNILYYLSGYVLGTLYRRIRNSSKPINEYSQQILSILTAGRVSEGYLDKSISKYVNAKDRGGLWKVSHDIFTMFSVIECHFQSETPGFTRKINCDSLVTTLLQDNYLLSLYSSVCGNANEKVKKEIALDLLEQIITLYVRI